MIRRHVEFIKPDTESQISHSLEIEFKILKGNAKPLVMICDYFKFIVDE